ncbi:coiled-coil domain-containing protein 81 isoform X1 [Anser cygnoides]|uniref:coiled-coil domain-containing protein 81 isoform X1 n=1 Tax=Anser cygnoides TaxID=8845 RepID=UPI0034D1721F
MEARSAPILCNGRLMCPTLMHLPDDGIVKVWDAVSHFIRRQFALNKGVRIPGLGAFFAVKQERPIAGFKLLDVKKPVFQVSEYFTNVHGLPYKKETFPGVPPFVFLNYAWLSLDTGIPRDTVQRCIQETLLFLSYTLAKKQGVDFIFKDIGCLVFRKSGVQMQFSSDFVHNLNSNGQLLKSRLSRTGTTDLATSERKSIVPHPASGGVIVFPRWARCFCGPWLSVSAAFQLLSGRAAVPGLAPCSGRSWRETFPSAVSSFSPHRFALVLEEGPFSSCTTAWGNVYSLPGPQQAPLRCWHQDQRPTALGYGALESHCLGLASRIGLYIPRGRAAGEGPLQAPKGSALEKNGDARLEGESNRTGVPPAIKSQLLTHQSPSLSRLSRATGEAKLGQAAGEKEPSPRLRTTRQESSSKMAEEGKDKRSAAAWPQIEAPACEGQRRAGQEICCLYGQEVERTLQALLAEEQLKKEWERQHVWEKCKARGERNGGENIWQKTQTEMPRLQAESASCTALVELKTSLQMVPGDMKQQHVLIPHPPEKKAETAPLSKSSTNCLSVRSVRVRKQLEKSKEALQDKTKSRPLNIPGNSAEDLLICVGEKVPVLPMPKMTRASRKPARTPRSCEQLSAQ